MTLLRSFLVLGMLVSFKAYSATGIPVNVDNFVRAETDTYMSKVVKKVGLGRFDHQRTMASIEKQDIVRMNRDTLYSIATFDLEAGPVTVTMPDVGSRYMSLGDVNQDHYVSKIIHGGESYTYTMDKVGTRYVSLLVRVFANPADEKDMRAAHAAQDGIKVEQKAAGNYEIPQWDMPSLAKVRNVIKELSSFGHTDFRGAFGSQAEVNPVKHLLGTAVGWGGNPVSESVYFGVMPKQNDGKTVYRLTVRDVPVKAFWSVSVYNSKGFFQKNNLNAYSLNSITATKGDADFVTIQFGGCTKGTTNCLPIMKGWNYTVRLYQPEQSVIKGDWKLPEPQIVDHSGKLSSLD